MVVVSTAAFHLFTLGVRFPVSHPLSIVGSLRDREVACSASDRQSSNLESCVWGAVSSHSSHHPQEVLLVQFSLYVHKVGLRHHSFHFLQAIPTNFELGMECDKFTPYTKFWTTPYKASKKENIISTLKS